MINGWRAFVMSGGEMEATTNQPSTAELQLRPCSSCGRSRADCRTPDNPFLSCCNTCAANDGDTHTKGAVVDRQEQPIQVGDRVRCTGGTTTGEVTRVQYADGKTTGTPGIHDYATITMDRPAGWEETFPVRTLTRLPSGAFRDVLARCVERLDEHLDRDVADTYQGQPLAQDWARVAKVVEEAGEAIAELIGMTGQNPRKGVTSNEERLLSELADVTLTGLYAIQHFTKDADRTLALLLDKTIYHCDRVGVDVID